MRVARYAVGLGAWGLAIASFRPATAEAAWKGRMVEVIADSRTPFFSGLESVRKLFRIFFPCGNSALRENT